MSAAQQRIAIIGGGPAGSLLAILLARRGLKPVVIERGAPFSASPQRGGRSINLALAARGIAALRRVGIDADVRELLIPMRGRMLHDVAGNQRFLAYGQRATEEIYSVSRAALNALLHELAAERHGVEYRFGEQCVGVTARRHAADRRGSDGPTAALTADIVLRAQTAPAPQVRGARRAAARSGPPRNCSTTATRS